MVFAVIFIGNGDYFSLHKLAGVLLEYLLRFVEFQNHGYPFQVSPEEL
jgi:hypothetical protein